MNINRAGTQASSKGLEEYFTGSVHVDTHFKAAEPGRSSAGSVTFEPRARTAWHTHPLGQAILITAGYGWVQRKGGPIEEVRPGDTVWFAAGEKHWQALLH